MRSAKHEALAPISFVLPGWMRTPMLPIFVANEIRAVFPAWLLAMVALQGGWALPEEMRPSALMIFSIGCSAIASISFGHDFTHGTLITALIQPLERERLWRVRFRVTAVALLPLALCAGVQAGAFQWLEFWGRTRAVPPVALFFGAELLIALFVAPWLTLLCRNTLAGSVFSVTLPFFLKFLSGMIFPGNTFVFFVLIGVVCAAAHWAAWNRFLRLEAIEPRQTSLRLPGGIAARPHRASSVRAENGPWLKLVSKELRLQCFAFVPAAALLVTSYLMQMQSNHGVPREMLVALSIFWVFLICILIGSVASAEERHLGIAEWHYLQPVSTLTQWLLKAAVLYALAFVLAVLLPMLALFWVTQEGTLGNYLVLSDWFFGGVVVAVTASIYLSSLCRSSIQAIMLSLPVCGAAWYLSAVGSHAYLAARRSLQNRIADAQQHLGEVPSLLLWDQVTMAVVCGFVLACLVLLHFFAWKNHFSAERGAGRVLAQVGKIAALIFAGIIVSASLFSYALNE